MLGHIVGDVDEFFRSTWLKSPALYRHRFGPGEDMEPPFDLRDAEELFINAAANGDQDTLLTFDAGKQTDVRSPFFAYSTRCSVVVNKADRYSRALHKLCEDVASDTFPYAFCNVYLTPPNSQTVPAHSDDRDVLLVQVMGRKHWRVYGNPPVELPYKDEEVGKGARKLTPEQIESLGVVLEDFVEAGDVLYMPRGCVHEARTSEEGSLHLTIALQTSDWDSASLIRGEVTRLLRTIKTARTVFDRSSLSAVPSPETSTASLQDREAFTRTISELTSKFDFDAAFNDFRARLNGMRTQRREFLAKTLLPVPCALALDSLVMWNPSVNVLGVEPSSSDNVKAIAFVVGLERMIPEPRSSLTLSLSREMMTVIRWMSSTPGRPRAVGDLPMFDELSKLCFANLLLRNGALLRVTA